MKEQIIEAAAGKTIRRISITPRSPKPGSPYDVAIEWVGGAISVCTHAIEAITASGPVSISSGGSDVDAPIPMRLTCPECGELHVDEGEFATKPHHTHSCQSCGLTWRPAVVHTVGVRFLPGFKSEAKP